MNKKIFKMILPAVIIFTAGAAIKAFTDFQNRKKEPLRNEEVHELILSIKNVLQSQEVTTFNEFAEYLNEYYNITPVCDDNGEIVYHSPKFKFPINRNELSLICSCQIIPYDMCDFENYFIIRSCGTGTNRNGLIIGDIGHGRAFHPWDNLKKCPKCGDFPWFVGKDGKDFYSGSPYKIICSNRSCDCQSIQSDNFELCKEDWNRKRTVK